MGRLQDELAECFFRHGHPSYEEPGWAAVVSLQVLILQGQEKLMSSIQDMKDGEQKVADALVTLNSSVAAAIAGGLGTGGGNVPPGTTVINSADQAILDAAVSQAESNAAKVGEIQALLNTSPTPPASPASPPSGAGPVSPTSPAATTSATPPASSL